MTISTEMLQEAAQRLFPNWSIDRIFAQLLLERAQKNLIRYEALARQFEQKYQESFDAFRSFVIGSDADEQTEQDYFDWELAVTGAEDMEREIERLKRVIEQT